MAIIKQCERCDSSFATRSNTSARWEKLCSACYNEKRRASIISNAEDKTARSISAIEDRMLALEETINSHIPALVGAEVSNHLENIIGQDIIDNLMKRAMESIEDSMQNFVDRQIKFENKIQRQLTTLNNKIISLMKDKGE